jgi:hypothetical protein
MTRRLAVLPAAVFVLLSAVPAVAQDAGQARSTLGASQGSQTFSVKGKVSVFGAMGLDLDVLGDISVGGIGEVRGTPTLIQQAAFPDVYVKTQRRRYLGASFGFKRKTEIMVRYQEAANPAATILLGIFGTNDNTFPVTVDDYKDRLVEFGIRHYFATPKRSREYFSLLVGRKTVDAISMTMRPPGGPIPVALYSKSAVPSISLDFGVSLEYGHVGIFLESGARWQKNLTRDDTDLAKYQLDGVNDSGARLFMPATLGLHVRF